MRLLPKEKHSPAKNIIWLCVALVLIFTTFILTIVATAGSTANYKPINEIYIGKADISHINVSKVIPQMSPILTILGSALTAPNSSLDDIFGSLKAISETPALSPLLVLLSNAENTTQSIISLTELAPLALEANPTEATKELVDISGLLKISNNGNQTLKGLEELIIPAISHVNDTQVAQTSNITLQLLANSNDPLNSTESLKILNSLNLTEKSSLLPVFTLFQNTNNVTALVNSLSTIMQSSESISSSQANTMMNTLSQMLATSTNLTQTFNAISNMVNDEQRVVVNAIESMLQSSSNVTTTLTTLGELIESNITENESAKKSLPALINIINNSNNVTRSLETVRSLALVSNTDLANDQLVALSTILNATDNQNQTLTIITSLQNGLSPNSTTIKYVPSLFTLLGSSKNAAASFSSLVTLTAWAQENPQTFTPIMEILHNAKSVEPISPQQLTQMTPTLLQYLKIPIFYRLSIFTLCTADINDTIIECNSPHAVQDLDFRNIIYDALVQSDFQPYMNGLNISADDLYLDGKLLDRQHEYVPSVKAVLSMNILTIITSFVVLCFVIYILIIGWKKTWVWYTTITLCLAAALFSGLSGTITAIIVEVIKSGTHDDAYGVVYTTGESYAGLIWSGFAFVFVSAFIIAAAAWYCRKHMKSRQVDEEDKYDSSAADYDSNGNIMLVPTKTSNDDMISDEKGIATSRHVEEAQLNSSSFTQEESEQVNDDHDHITNDSSTNGEISNEKTTPVDAQQDNNTSNVENSDKNNAQEYDMDMYNIEMRHETPASNYQDVNNGLQTQEGNVQ